MERDGEKIPSGDFVTSAPDANSHSSSPSAATAMVTTSTILKHSHNGDEALQAFQDKQFGEIIEIDDATNRRLLRKIDWNLMPIMCIVYGLNYLDKTTLSYASIMGIKKDIALTGDDYQWLSSMFYFGYIAFEYPTNLLLQRLPLAKYSSACVIAWGAVLCCFAAVENFGGAVAIRFLLGVCEAAVTPGFVLLTSQWYTKREQGMRTGIWVSFNGWAQILGGLVAYGIARGTANGQTSIAGWKIVFLVTGLLTVIMGIVFYFIIPDNQLNARWLSKEDRVLAVERIRINSQGIGNKTFKWYQFREAIMDPLTWAFFLYALLADIPNGGISNFFSQLIVSFGYTPQQSLLYGTPGGAVEVITLLATGWLGDHYGNRLLFASSGLILSIIGMSLIVGLPLDQNSGRLGGYYLTQSSVTGFICFLSLIASNVSGYTKKTTVCALFLIGYCAGNIIGPQTFRPRDAPRYVPAEITIIVCWGLCLVIIAFVYGYCRWQNTKKAKLRAQPGYVKVENQEFLDLTDWENPEFVYTV